MSIESDILDSILQRVGDDFELSENIIHSLRKELLTVEKPNVGKIVEILNRHEMANQE